MKLIIAGSRTINPSVTFIDSSIEQFNLSPTEIVSGGARGVDTGAENYAVYIGIDFKEFPADWDTHGKKAGYLRNKQMAEHADCLLLIWDGESRGSASMKREMQILNKSVYEVILRNNET